MKRSLFALALAVCLLGAAEMWGQTTDPTTTVYVSGPATSEIRATTWGPACTFPMDAGVVASGGSQFKPTGIEFAGDGRLYFTDDSHSEVGRLNTDGSVDVISSSSSSTLENPTDIIFAGGDAIVTTRAGSKKSEAGLYIFPEITSVADGGPFVPPTSLVQFSSGGGSSAEALGMLFERTILATESSDEEALGFSYPYGPMGPSSLTNGEPLGIAAYGVGNGEVVYVAYPRTGQIKRFAPEFVGGIYAGLVEDTSWIVTLPAGYKPRHLDTDLEGNLYVTGSKRSNGRDGQLYCVPSDFPGGTPAASIPFASAWGVAVAAGSEVTRSSDFGSPLKLCGDQITLTSGTESFTVDLTCRDITEAEFRDYASDSEFPFAECLQEPGKNACTLIEISGVPPGFDDTVLVERIFVPFANFDAGTDGQYGTADDLVKDPGILYSSTGGTDAFTENILTGLSDALIDDIDPTRMTGKRDNFGSQLLFCEDCNGDPRFDALQDVEVEADLQTGQANVQIDVTVLDLGPLTFKWELLDGPGGSPVQGPPLATTENLDEDFGSGEHFVRFTAADAGFRQRSADDEVKITVTVTDAEPPTVTDVTATPNNLWPPNHEFVAISMTVTATDNYDVPECRVVSITHDEAIDGQGDGSTDPDWEYLSAQSFTTGPLSVLMRAERAENSNGRTYTATVECRDTVGNISDPLTRDVVTVQDNQGGGN